MSYNLLEAHNRILASLREAAADLVRTQTPRPSYAALGRSSELARVTLREVGSPAETDCLALASLFYAVGRQALDYDHARGLLELVRFWAVLSRAGQAAPLGETLCSRAGLYVAHDFCHGAQISGLRVTAQSVGSGWLASGIVRDVANWSAWEELAFTAKTVNETSVTLLLFGSLLDRERVHRQAQPHAERSGVVHLDGVAAPARARLLADPWSAQAVMLQNLERLCLGSFWVGVAQGVYDRLSAIVVGGTLLGQRLSSFQAVRLAMSGTLLTAHAGRCALLDIVEGRLDLLEPQAGPLSLRLLMLDRLQGNLRDLIGAIPRGARADSLDLERISRELEAYRGLGAGSSCDESILATSLLSMND